ncbi:MAG: hypothetical protein FWH23_04595, partial [Bacteroidales bacterium]|nr:hypothetical protein [Bacteroidales bacterium]
LRFGTAKLDTIFLKNKFFRKKIFKNFIFLVENMMVLQKIRNNISRKDAKTPSFSLRLCVFA